MLKNDLHRLLRRQLKKADLTDVEGSKFMTFLSTINDAYKSFDKDIYHIEHILEESSKELFAANKKLVIEQNITQTKLEQVLDNVGGVIFETDISGNFTFLNNAWAKYSGYSIEMSLGKNFKDFLLNENIDGTKKIHQLFSKKKAHTELIFKNIKNGKVFWFELKSKQFIDKDGLPIGYIGTIIDVTNLKEIEIELQKASKLKDEFLSTMSHEIRTPLNAVTGLTNILLMEEYMPGQLENLNALKHSGDHLLGLINDLLDFDKIQSGKQKLVEKDFNLNNLLEAITSEFILRAKKKGVKFSIKKGNDIPDNIIGDKLRLAQIIKNLLSNSLKFTNKGGVILSVQNLCLNNNNVSLKFKVKDTGIGISKDKHDTIFESFMQAYPDTSIKYGGTGLGLSITKKLLNLQNSDLEIESELGRGATFSFIIDYKISNRLSHYQPEMIEIQPDYQPLNINVLIAEDNKMNVLILKRFFLKWKINCEVAENGMQVLQFIKNTNLDFNVILMDLQMSILNGYEATRLIRGLPDPSKANIPIIALTAFAQTDIKEKTKEYDFNGFMGKPFNPLDLYTLLKSYSKYGVNKTAI